MLALGIFEVRPWFSQGGFALSQEMQNHPPQQHHWAGIVPSISVGYMEKPGSWSSCRDDSKGGLEHEAQQECRLGRRPRHRFVLVAEGLSKKVPFYCLVFLAGLKDKDLKVSLEHRHWPQYMVSTWPRALCSWSQVGLWWVQSCVWTP